MLDCRTCGFIFAPDVPSDAMRHGADFHTARHENVEAGLATVNNVHFLWYWASRLRWPAGTHILDIGCAEGRLLEAARSMGFIAAGIDVSGHDAARWKANALTAEAAVAQEYAKTHAGNFDVIIARAVIEHVADPAGFLRACASMLKPGGTCLIETADAESVHARVLGERWTYWIPAEGIGAHVSFLSRRSAAVLGSRCGLDLRDSVPSYRYLPFSWYVQERRGRGRNLLTLAKYLVHRSRLSGGRCLWFVKPT